MPKTSVVPPPSSSAAALDDAPPRGGSRRAVRNGDLAAQNNGDEDWELEILQAMLAFRRGEFTTRLPAGWIGVRGKIADAFNDILGMSERRSGEAARVSRVVGKEGRLTQRMTVTGMVGGWADEIEALNTLMDDLVRPTTEVTRTIGAVAKGDLGQSMAIEVDGHECDVCRDFAK